MLKNFLNIAFLSMILGSCFQISISSKAKLQQSGAGSEETNQAVSRSSGETKEIASIDPNASTNTQLTTPKVEGLKGASVILPPGSLSIAAEIVVEQAAELGETSISNEMGLASDIGIAAATPGMIIRPTENVDLKKPLSLAMPLPVGMGFRLQEQGSRYGVFYKYFDPSEQKLVTGLKVVDGINVTLSYDEKSQKDILNFEGYFGAYWAAILTREVKPAELPPPKPAEEPIINKAKVAVIEGTGIVQETQVLAKQAIPEIQWEKPSISFDNNTRSVSIKSTPLDNQKVSACKVDLFETQSAKGGLSLETPLGPSVTIPLTVTNAITYYGRFRCTDSENRLTISSWSDPITIPAAIAPAVNTVGAELCNDTLSSLVVRAFNESGDLVVVENIPRVAKCKYEKNVFIEGDNKFFVSTPSFGFTCGLATHGINLGSQKINCQSSLPNSPGSDFLSMPPSNYKISLDFSTSLTQPDLNLSLIPCSLGDLFLKLDAIADPVTSDMKFTHLGACEYVKTSSSLTYYGIFSIRNAAGDFSCGAAANEYLYMTLDNNWDNRCGNGSLRSSYWYGYQAAPSYNLKVKLGESLAQEGGDASLTSRIVATANSNCPDKMWIDSNASGHVPIDGVNTVRRTGACQYRFPIAIDQANLADYAFYFKSIDSSRVCGGTLASGAITLDCSANAPAIAVTGEVGKAYDLNIGGDAVTGTFSTSASFYPAYGNCFGGMYLDSSPQASGSHPAATSMSEVHECVFEKLWTPTTANPGFYLSDGQNKFYGIGDGMSTNPSRDGSFTLLKSVDSGNSVNRISPTNITPGVSYRVRVDLRADYRPTVSIHSYNPDNYVCANDLYFVEDSFHGLSPISPNRMTHDGLCNYTITLKNLDQNTRTFNFKVVNSALSEVCTYTGTPYFHPGSSIRKVPLSCGTGSTLYGITMNGRETYRFTVARQAGGAPQSIIGRNLTSLYTYQLQTAVNSIVPFSAPQLNTYDPLERIAIISSTHAPFNLQRYYDAKFCFPINGRNLLNSPMPFICNTTTKSSNDTFGPYASGNYEVKVFEPGDYESPSSLTVSPVTSVSALVDAKRISSNAQISTGPSATPNSDTTTSPGSLSGSMTWSDVANQTLYMFGGFGWEGAYRNNLWKYTLGTNPNVWTLVDGGADTGNEPTSSSPMRPGARASAVTWFDEAQGRLYLFGGTGYGTSGTVGHLSDLWYFQISDSTWHYVNGTQTVDNTAATGSIGVSSSSYHPGPRYGASAFQDPSGNFWLFGGRGPNGDYNDIWRFVPSAGNDSSAGMWAYFGGDDAGITQAGSSVWPSARAYSASWTVGNNIYVYSGMGIGLNDMWTFDFGSKSWTRIQASTPGVLLWQNTFFQSGNRPPFITAPNVVTWNKGPNELFMMLNGTYFTFNPSLNSWAVSVADGNLNYGVFRGPTDPSFANTTNFDAFNFVGTRQESAYWDSVLGTFFYGGFTTSPGYRWNDLWQLR